MADPQKDIDRLQREMDQARTDAANAGKGEMVKAPKNQNLDAVVTGAGTLLVLELALGKRSHRLHRGDVAALRGANQLRAPQS